ncbi:MAG: hypothetical protein K0S93_74 [Nitrososphaeraceae archaeon]|jgi:hypothetical protein|nr:hypothetical protein [Nitrososphaeraceae archaeon]
MKSIYAFSAVVTLLLVANAAKMVYSEENSPVNQVISEGLQECSQLQSDSCLGVMHALNNICSVEYFPACFGESWEPMMHELKKIYEHEGKDPFVTQNNEHYGNDSSLN